MGIDRRRFLTLTGAGAGFALSGSLGGLLTASPAGAGRGNPGYGRLVRDPAGLLDLPRGFRYRVFSREAIDLLDDGSPVPASHDGMAAFEGRHGRTVLVRNHELDLDGVAEEGLSAVPHAAGMTYDPDVVAGGRRRSWSAPLAAWSRLGSAWPARSTTAPAGRRRGGRG